MSLVIHAVNVHVGGGKVLLSALLEALPRELQVVAQLHQDMPLPEHGPQLTVRRVPSSIGARLGAEFWLRKHARVGDTVLCFGNLPPLFKLRAHTVLFLQNRNLVDAVDLSGFAWPARLRILMERQWLARRTSNADMVLVQTESMKVLVEECGLAQTAPVRVAPFLTGKVDYPRRVALARPGADSADTFLYVASGEPNKNHRRLIDAWILLAAEGLHPRLILTLDMHAPLTAWISAQAQTRGLHIEIVQPGSHAGVAALYRRAAALIYPSLFESFGMPLLEARQAGLPIVASERDYVRDLLDPEQSFDPLSARSIARAVKRHLGMEQEILQLLPPAAFLKTVMPDQASCAS
jgi:glycosyltransferase involved in cell wall biosynthesis